MWWSCSSHLQGSGGVRRVGLAIGLGVGGEIQAALARVVIGGLTTSTLITLVVIPVIYMILEELSERVPAAEAERRAADPMEPVRTPGD